MDRVDVVEVAGWHGFVEGHRQRRASRTKLPYEQCIVFKERLRDEQAKQRKQVKDTPYSKEEHITLKGAMHQALRDLKQAHQECY